MTYFKLKIVIIFVLASKVSPISKHEAIIYL